MKNKDLFPDALHIKQLAGGFYLVVWIDEDDSLRCASIVTEDDSAVGLCFAFESNESHVEISDSGLISCQYMSEEQKLALENIGLTIGKTFPNFDEFINFCNF